MITVYEKALLAALLLLIFVLVSLNHYGKHPFEVSFATTSGMDPNEQSIIYDPNLNVESISKGLSSPTTMAFLGPDDILVLEKDNGTVRRIVNGNLLDEPVLHVKVANQKERGMLGIAISNDKNFTTGTPNHERYIFLYYTQSHSQGGDATGNHLYRYEFINDKLVNPKLLLTLPHGPGRLHNGGVVTIGPDANVYLMVGDVKGPDLQNKSNALIDGRGGILRVTQDGEKVGNGILGQSHPIDKYYAYGIRNGFGMGFDPITGKLWDTENGASLRDEINLVEPGFNSGWQRAQGFASGNKGFNPHSDLMNFEGRSNYSDPEFVFHIPVGVTAIGFLNSDKFGKQYQNDMFVGDINNGNLYHFELNENRTGLYFDHQELKDNIANSYSQIRSTIIGTFKGPTGGITDIKTGPDGYLYLVSYGQGAIYRIVPKS